MLTNYKIITIQAIKFHKLICSIATTFSTTRTITYIPSNSAIDTQRRSLVAGPGRLLPRWPPASLRCYGAALCLAGRRSPSRAEGRQGAGGRSRSLRALPARLRHSAPARPAPLPLPLPVCAGVRCAAPPPVLAATAATQPLNGLPPLGLGWERRASGTHELGGEIDRRVSE